MPAWSARLNEFLLDTKMSELGCSTISATPTDFKVGEAVTHMHFQTLDPFNIYADNFDLSLLPQDCATSNENIPTIVYQYTGLTPTTTPTPEIKVEHTWPTNTITDIKQEQNYLTNYEQQTQQQQFTKTSNQLIPPPPYPHIYPTPQSSPAQSDYAFPHTPFNSCYESLSSSRTSLFSSSPCPSIDTSAIKQELHILPPSPPESNCEAPSPQSTTSNADIKTEPFDTETESLIDLNTYLSSANQSQPSDQAKLQQQDHQVLREYLVDDSFQRKHNLKPLALESFIGGLEEVRSDIDSVISLALDHAKREVDEICAKLQISKDPNTWSATQVHSWLRSTIAQYKLQQIDNLETIFIENGSALVLLSEEEFMRRVPEGGSTLHAKLEIWKLAYLDSYQNNILPQQQQVHHQQQHQLPLQQQLQLQSTENNSVIGSTQLLQSNIWNMDYNMNIDEESEDEDEIIPTTSNGLQMPTTTNSGTTATTTTTGTTETKRSGVVGGRSGGSHIHLWQFLKELLSEPHINGTAIRWIDRSKGIFKIEDSVRVAKLWGRRKNRPAMNYDKLSRSIRQYYKKGIMKKTERSQRLVYQFCHPYHLQ
ncbi:DNA-binding protein D-ETS-4 isoform X2 [Teleopsis dalmanni]|uniref:DNA-binding protein D-ETS-4 isoform X2 n=1 Tax=Teleopsis dalmanni TaxID=139649 RepID=UPI0018CEF28F|nr:DNA-binding protein D-ETS-4 isoform X2 [Teleopsis dalmanni]